MFRKNSVLIIEDDTDISFLLETIFKGNDINCFSVQSLTSAKNALEVLKPAYVVLDNMLPDGKGIDFIDYLNRKFPDIKIVFSTGDYDNDQIEGIKNRIYKIIKKPITMENIRNVMEEIV